MLKELIANKDISEIKAFMAEHNLVLDGNKIVPKDKDHIKNQKAFWNQRQQAR